MKGAFSKESEIIWLNHFRIAAWSPWLEGKVRVSNKFRSFWKFFDHLIFTSISRYKLYASNNVFSLLFHF